MKAAVYSIVATGKLMDLTDPNNRVDDDDDDDE